MGFSWDFIPIKTHPHIIMHKILYTVSYVGRIVLFIFFPWPDADCIHHRVPKIKSYPATPRILCGGEEKAENKTKLKVTCIKIIYQRGESVCSPMLIYTKKDKRTTKMEAQTPARQCSPHILIKYCNYSETTCNKRKLGFLVRFIDWYG